ncbi:MAG TPA: universal stress protein [Steroidobacteraceae bacterium]|jgi:universal stress protein E|nr:universal stress protein [Steroidobacteraceae bacterium]
MTGTTPSAPGSAVDVANLAVIIDPTSTKQPALAKAFTLATQFGAAVTLLSFDTKQLRGMRLARKSPWRNHLPNYSSLASWLDHFAIPLRARGIAVTTEVVSGESAEESLLRWLQQSDADFVLKDVREASPKRTPLTDTDRHLVKFCPMPLLLSKSRQWQDSPIVVAAVDPLHGSDPNALLDHEIMAYAAHVANRLSGKLHVFHALFPAASAATAIDGMLLQSEVDRALAVDEQRRHWAINAFVRRYSVDKRHLHVKIGVPDTHLPRIAMDHNANIVVMGALARNRATSPDIGSTAESVFESLPCDVLVIKSPLAP